MEVNEWIIFFKEVSTANDRQELSIYTLFPPQHNKEDTLLFRTEK